MPFAISSFTFTVLLLQSNCCFPTVTEQFGVLLFYSVLDDSLCSVDSWGRRPAVRPAEPSPELASCLLVCWLVSLGVGRSVVWWSVCWLVVCRFARSPLHSAGGADKWRGVQIIQNTRQTLDRILSGSSGSPARLQRSPRPRTQTRTHNTGELQKYPASGLKERNKGTTDLITGRTARTRENPRDQQYCEVLSQLRCRPASLCDRFNDHCPAFECECHYVSVPATTARSTILIKLFRARPPDSGGASRTKGWKKLYWRVQYIMITLPTRHHKSVLSLDIGHNKVLPIFRCENMAFITDQ